MPLSHWRLVAYLAAQPPETASVTLTFAEAGELLGGPLPRAAGAPVWWTVRPKVARRPGWRMGRPQLTPAGWVVTFRRVPPDSRE